MKDLPKAYAAITFTTILWGVSFIASKLALETMTVFSYVFSRFLLASIIFALLLIRRGIPKLDGKTAIQMLFLALLQPFGYFVFETLGLKYTSATKASLLIALVPIVVAVTARIALKESIRKKTVIGIFLSITGVALLVTGGREADVSLAGSLKGDLFILGAVFSAAIYTVLAGDISKRLSPFYITAFQVFLGTIFFLPFFLADVSHMNWQAVSLRSAFGVIYNVLGGTIGGFLCYNYALSHIRASTAAIFINGIPIITALGAWLILGEILAPLQLIGGGIVIFSVVFTSWVRKAPPTEKAPPAYRGS